MDYLTHNEIETEALGETLARRLGPGDVVAYRGDLGAGKTAFTRGLARGLGCTGRVTSPTFTVVNEYEGRLPLFHFDLYRLEGEDALYDVGWEDYLDRVRRGVERAGGGRPAPGDGLGLHPPVRGERGLAAHYHRREGGR